MTKVDVTTARRRDEWREMTTTKGKLIKENYDLKMIMSLGDTVMQTLRDGKESAEQRAAAAEAQRDTAWQELREIRRLIEADKDESTADEVTRKLYRLSKDTHDAEQEAKKLRERTRQVEAERDAWHTMSDLNNAGWMQAANDRDEARRELEQAQTRIAELEGYIDQHNKKVLSS